MILALLGGLIIGLLLGMLGGGGAILAIPLLIYGFSFSATQATAASLIIIGLGALIGLISQYAAGHVRLKEGLSFGLLGLVGSFVGSHLASNIPDSLLLSGFAILTLVVALTMISKLRSTREYITRRPSILAIALSATGVGFLTGFFGVGGGFAIVPALIFALGFSIRQASATSLVVIAVNSAIAMGFRYSDLASIDWSVISPIIITTVLGAFSGVKLAKKVKASSLQLGFAGFLIFISIYMGFQNFPGLF